MDLTYATIPVFGGDHRRLYKEAQLAYIISDEYDPTKHPRFSLDTDFGSILLQITDAPEPPLEIRKFITLSEYSPPITFVWNFFFMEPLLEKVMVVEWSLFPLLKKVYLCPTS
jgi:hypothetical protein